jgi:hypothetical protein
MDPISNADRLVMLLKQKLQERSKTAGSGRSGSKAKASVATPTQPSAVHALAAVDGADEGQVRRAFIQHLLADQLGPALINDAQFQQVVSRVTEAIEDDAHASRLLSRLIADLRAS